MSLISPWFARSKTGLCAFFRIAVFSVSVFYDERIVVVAEQRPDASEEDSFQWMSRVLQVQQQILQLFGLWAELPWPRGHNHKL